MIEYFFGIQKKSIFSNHALIGCQLPVSNVTKMCHIWDSSISMTSVNVPLQGKKSATHHLAKSFLRCLCYYKCLFHFPREITNAAHFYFN